MEQNQRVFFAGTSTVHRRDAKCPKQVIEDQAIVKDQAVIPSVGTKKLRHQQQQFWKQKWKEEEQRTQSIICWGKGRQAHQLAQIDTISRKQGRAYRLSLPTGLRYTSTSLQKLNCFPAKIFCWSVSLHIILTNNIGPSHLTKISALPLSTI
jgi:hypothetical protein